ncbi:MAG: 50S ribosomal protein L13 [Candidatus Kariarchaeaceae archaeon]|jgi:large subunit ribosomal protein L13
MDQDKIYIDGTGLVLGRLSSWIARQLMAGERIVVVNADKVIISGRRRHLIEDHLQRRDRATHTNPRRGPFYPRFPDRILRRTVRGMLPWKKTTGRLAFKRLQAYIDVPENMESMEFQTVDIATRKPTGDYMTVGELSRTIGWQHGVN